MSEQLTCPRCGGTEFYDIDCGPDSWDDDIFYISERCKKCELWHDGWNDNWYDNIDSWQDTEYETPFQVTA